MSAMDEFAMLVFGLGLGAIPACACLWLLNKWERR